MGERRKGGKLDREENWAEGKRSTEVEVWIVEFWSQEDGNDLVVCAGAAGARKLG